jgi:uncharacterized membrane protein YidH (DUF202 family)
MSSNDNLDDYDVAAEAGTDQVSPSRSDDVALDMDNGESSATPLLSAAATGADYASIAPSPPKKGKDKGKKDKSGQKLVADALKTDMAAERTFFKWLWTGLHTGAIGTFIFVTFDSDKEDPYRIAVVTFAWFISLALVLYGLFAYNRRRQALRDGNMDLLPAFTREYGPYIVVVCLVLVVGSGLLYAAFSGVHPHQGKKAGAFGALQGMESASNPDGVVVPAR